MPQGKIHVLLIEDEVAHALLVKRAFDRQAPEATLTVASTLAEARAYLKETAPHLILSDWHLPDGESITLLKEATLGAPVVVMTSHGNEAAAVEAMKAGAFDYVVKSTEALQDMPRLAARVLRAWSHNLEKQQAEEALRDSEARTAAILHASLDSIITVDEEGRVLDFNPAAEQTFGYQIDEIQGRSIMELIVPPHTHETQHQGMAHFLTPGENALLHRRVKMSALRADGSKFPIEMVVQPIELKARTLFTAYLRDITERNAFEKALIEAKERAEENNRLKTTFLNNISHEIRTPLTAIIGFSSILNTEVTESQQEMVQLIEHSGKRLLNTLNSVLDLSMLEAGTLNLEREWFKLEDMVQEKIKMFRSEALDNEVEIGVDCSVPEAEIYLDRTCTGRILDHLLDNALKFTEAGSVRVGISVKDDVLVLRVEDTGVGIEEGFLPHMYDEFKQESTGNTRSYEGTGLGLAITKRMVDLMGGSITVQSQKGKGSAFAVRFPSRLLRLPSKHPVPMADGSATVRPKPRILAVEDSAEIEVLLAYILQESYSVDVVKNEQDMRAKIQGPPYDLMLMDINLSGPRTGVDIMQDLRNSSAYARVPIIAMTAYALLEDRDRFLDAGFDGYISKPFTTKELLTLIEQMLSIGVRKRSSVFSADKVRD